MSTDPSLHRFRQALTGHTKRMGECASKAGSEALIPTCPDWTMTNLVEHVGQTHHWVSEIIERRITDPSQLPSTDLAVLPAEPQSWPTWLSAAAARSAAAFSDAALEAQVFNPAGDERTGARFWLRTLLNETVIHGFDAVESAGEGEHYDIDADVAAALISNHLAMLTSPGWAAQRPESATALRGAGETLLWRATDEPSSGDSYEWFVERHPDGAGWQHRSDTAADVTVHGPARSLLLVLTRRLPLNSGRANYVDIDGDVDLARHWIQNTAHVAD